MIKRLLSRFGGMDSLDQISDNYSHNLERRLAQKDIDITLKIIEADLDAQARRYIKWH